jgi:hypothetical protein
MEYVIMAAPLLSGAVYPTEILTFPGVNTGAAMVEGTVRGVAVACAEFAPRPLAFEVLATK